MQIRVLGPIEIHGDLHADTGGRRILVGGPKQPALLAVLVVRAGRAVSIDRLIHELWGEDPPANATNALQAHIKRLRRLIASAGGEPDRIVTRSPGYLLDLRPGETDVEQFTAQLAQARRIAVAEPDRAVPILRAALRLWRGPAFDGCLTGEICTAEAAVLEESRLTALETLYDASLRAGRHEEIIGELAETTAAYPLRERLHAQLMVALYRADRQSEAIGVYDRARQRLLCELGVEPGPALRSTVAAILAQSPRLDEATGTGDPLRDELAVLRRQIDTLARRQAALLSMINQPGS